MPRIKIKKISPLFPLTLNIHDGLVVRVYDDSRCYFREVMDMVGLPCKIDVDHLCIPRLRHRDPLFIPKLYAALSHFTKADDDSFDSWKGSFGFKFFLKVEKAGVSSKFMHRIFQFRRNFRAPIYQLVPSSSAPPVMGNGRVLEGPPDVLFSQNDFEAYSKIFFDRMLDLLETTGYAPEPFLITAASERRLAGFNDGKYFESHVDANENFLEVIDTYRKKGLKVVK